MKFRTALLLMALILVAARPSAAAPITWTSEYDPTDVLIDEANSSLSYTHDLTAAGFVPGFASSDQITLGVLDLYFRDDTARDSAGHFKLTLEGLVAPGTLNGEADQIFDFNIGFDPSQRATVLASLQQDGILNVLIRRHGGPQSDFIFERSIFMATGTRDDITVSPSDVAQDFDLVSVPEPASLSLLGAGLVALAAARRRRRR